MLYFFSSLDSQTFRIIITDNYFFMIHKVVLEFILWIITKCQKPINFTCNFNFKGKKKRVPLIINFLKLELYFIPYPWKQPFAIFKISLFVFMKAIIRTPEKYVMTNSELMNHRQHCCLVKTYRNQRRNLGPLQRTKTFIITIIFRPYIMLTL